jgi:uncharacterized repeat protein (TIGR01451 family)
LLLAFAAATQAVAQPTISCSTDPAIFNTGIDGSGGYSINSPRLAIGATDAQWQWAFEASTSNRDTDPATLPLSWSPATVYYHAPSTGNIWVAPTLENAQWIGLSSPGAGIFWYRYEFYLDPSVDPGTFNLPIKFNSDNNVYHIFVNGQDNLSLPTGSYVSSYTSASQASAILSQNWKIGLNQIFVVVSNVGGPAGLLLQASEPLCAGKLSVTKTTTQNTAVSAGQTGIPFEIMVANNGAADLSGAVLDDPLPAGLASGTWTCSENSTAAVCPAASGTLPLSNVPLNTLPAGSSLLFKVSATTASDLSATPVITNTATVTAPVGAVANVCLSADGSNSCEASASVSTGSYLSVDKTASGPGPFFEGDTVGYTITAANAGSVAVTGVSVNDALPAGLINGSWTCRAPVDSSAVCPADSGAMPLTASGISLPAHARLVYTVTATVDALTDPAVLTNTVTANASGGACWSGSASSALPCTASADVSVGKASSAVAVPLFGLLGYGLAGLGILGLAAWRRRRGG